ncbi:MULTISPECIES: ABC transporter ATP-binding protein [Alphaproteobacteria]|uniref:Sugar ABC transporter ATP-binding protein n=2 Tax=Alphaproteobacteria TaxID=28211 RepID=A0A512HNA5_9HYPH|nr:MULTISPECIES: ABC transporter ATP-binding protein [Alphaproteobacteria]GEO86922.1 sugar ABC transporter ATP-binding protein [Ciceribacter naphthalenivorans]GLR22236.1 sugar ABC transporter ATP-binding protein [Ciceribacter naphthalenivorans]GLT05092.1 sugar ABC transporter ATP-binding protein [Sphingomonas psychrolutea]
MAKVELRNVWKKFGPVEVIKGVSIDLEDGEFVVLVGPSGCGKSTLLNLIAGLETLTSGEIRIGDKLVNDVPPKDRNIAMVFQSYALYPTKTVQENITFGMQTRGVDRAVQDEALADVSQLLHIEQLLDRKPGQLSGGQRQRVAMGRALVRNPDVFLFDEPLSNLDAKLRIEMRTEVKKLHLRLGKTIVYVTHDQIEAMTLASRIAVMDNGHVRQFGTPEEVYENPVDLFVAGFMGSPSMNIVKGRVVNEGGYAIAVSDEEGTILFPLNSNQTEKVTGREGEEIHLGLRPEAITHVGAHSVRQSDLFAFERVVDVVEPTGPDTMLVFTLGGIEAIARVRPEERVKPGEIFRFEVNMGKAKLFDGKSGMRL